MQDSNMINISSIYKFKAVITRYFSYWLSWTTKMETTLSFGCKNNKNAMTQLYIFYLLNNIKKCGG